MLGTTTTAIKSILQADPSVTPHDRKKLLTVLRNGPEAAKKQEQSPEPLRLLRRGEVGKMLSISTRTVDMLASTGVLHKVVLPGRTRSSGFRSTDLTALIKGGE